MKKAIKILSIAVVLAAVLCIAAACGSAFVFATDIVDGLVVSAPQYSFGATATCGGVGCEIEVRCNGITAKSDGTRFTVYLNEGDNAVLLTAKKGSKKETRSYNIVYRADFVVRTDLSERVIRDDVLYFSAAAYCNDESCALTVTADGKLISPVSDGKYEFKLTENKQHEFVLSARSGDAASTLTETVFYEGFKVNTTLVSQDTASDTLSFAVRTTYGKVACETEVTVNGDVLSPNDGNYLLVMPQAGEYEVRVTARSGSMQKTELFSVRYSDAPPRFERLSLEEGKEYKGSVFTFEVTAEDALGAKLPDNSLSFFADMDADDGRDDFVALGQSDLKKVWSDSEKTSYRINFEEGVFEGCKGKAFLFRVVAEAFGRQTVQTFRMTYVGAGADGEIGEVVFSLEGFTVGCGYFIEPMLLTVFDGEPFSVTLTRLLSAYGLEYRYTGELDSGFYLASIKGLDLDGNRIADGLAERLEVFSYILQKDDDGRYSLGEFDYTSGSGWMYSVNGSFPNYGFADYFPQDGDVVRVCFTLALGRDVGGGDSTGGSSSDFAEFADYARVNKLLALIRENEFYGSGEEAYAKAVEEISVWDASQELVDRVYNELIAAYGLNLS